VERRIEKKEQWVGNDGGMDIKWDGPGKPF